MSTTVTTVTPPVTAAPDITYVPDYDKWQAGATRRVAAGGLPHKVPNGFPEQLTGKMVWEGRTLAETYDWAYTLSSVQLAEIEQSVAHFKCMYAII